MVDELATMQKLTKDVRAAAETLSDEEARYLVDYYYLIQEDRKRSSNQVRSMGEEPHSVIAHFADSNRTIENQIKVVLDRYSAAHPVGAWVREIKGVGPVIAAGLTAHISIEKAPTVGHIWRYAGLDPTSKWNKGEKRPWNAGLKTLCWKVGQSFCKFSGGEEPSFYGLHYRAQKAKYVAKNQAGGFAERATLILGQKKWGTTTDAIQWYNGSWVGNPKLNPALTAAHAGLDKAKDKGAKAAVANQEEFTTPRPMLPPAQIDQMAQRWATKLFLSDLHTAWYWLTFKALPPKPWVFTHGGHVDYVPSETLRNLPELWQELSAWGARTLPAGGKAIAAE